MTKYKYCFACGYRSDRPSKIIRHLSVCKSIFPSKLEIIGDNIIKYDGENKNMEINPEIEQKIIYTNNDEIKKLQNIIIEQRNEINSLKNIETSIETPVEIIEVPVEKIVEKIIEVPVEKIVEKIIEVPSNKLLQKIKQLENEIANKYVDEEAVLKIRENMNIKINNLESKINNLESKIKNLESEKNNLESKLNFQIQVNKQLQKNNDALVERPKKIKEQEEKLKKEQEQQEKLKKEQEKIKEEREHILEIRAKANFENNKQYLIQCDKVYDKAYKDNTANKIDKIKKQIKKNPNCIIDDDDVNLLLTYLSVRF